MIRYVFKSCCPENVRNSLECETLKFYQTCNPTLGFVIIADFNSAVLDNFLKILRYRFKVKVQKKIHFKGFS